MKKKFIWSILAVVVLAATGCASVENETKEPAAVDEAVLDTKETEQEPKQMSEAVAEALNLKHELRFQEDGTFRILVIGDVQNAFLDGSENEVVRNIETLVEREQPDLVFFNGDNSIKMVFEERLEEYLNCMVGAAESRGIPWAHVYGNHDTENPNDLTREEQQEIYERFDYCISKEGDPELHGVGNYVLPILRSDSDQIAFNVWALDSGDYRISSVTKEIVYDHIHFDQIAWYYNTSEELEAYNEASIPGMMLFHIPLKEMADAYEDRENPNLKFEGLALSKGVWDAELNSGLYAAALDRGDIKLVINSHDHGNDYSVQYGKIQMCYTGRIGPGGNTSFYPEACGARVVVLNQDEPEKIETYMSYIK